MFSVVYRCGSPGVCSLTFLLMSWHDKKQYSAKRDDKITVVQADKASNKYTTLIVYLNSCLYIIDPAKEVKDVDI